MYTTTNESLSLNILSIFLWNIDGAFFKPNGITSHSKCHSRKKTVGQESGCIVTCQNPDLQSNLLNIVQSFIFPNKYSFVGISYPSSSVLSFNLFVVNHHPTFSSFLFTMFGKKVVDL